MVWGVCRRLALNHHDAEDAFQATFLVLVRKAASVEPKEKVANWLHGVAFQTALKARSVAARRRQRERQVAELPEPTAAAPDVSPDLPPQFDEELNRLPERYRVAIVLCDLEGKTRKEAAQQLGWPEGTVAGRLATARKLLASRLARRGVVMSGGTLAAVLAHQAASAAVPASVVSSTIRAATRCAVGQPAAGVSSVGAAAFTEGGLKTMRFTKLKVVTVALVVVGLSGAAGLFYRTQAAERSEAEATIQKSDREKPSTASPKEGDAREAERAKDREATKLKGQWKAVAAEIGGKALPPEQARATVWQIDAGTITTQGSTTKNGKAEDVWPFTIDPTQKPAHIDVDGQWGGEKAVLKGIYKLDGDELTICIIGNDGGRPTEFSSGDLVEGHKGGYLLFKFQREKPKD
jgi:RNA polymerase sigma-70 factor (ECF subfamily)